MELLTEWVRQRLGGQPGRLGIGTMKLRCSRSEFLPIEAQKNGVPEMIAYGLVVLQDRLHGNFFFFNLLRIQIRHVSTTRYTLYANRWLLLRAHQLDD